MLPGAPAAPPRLPCSNLFGGQACLRYTMLSTGAPIPNMHHLLSCRRQTVDAVASLSKPSIRAPMLCSPAPWLPPPPLRRGWCCRAANSPPPPAPPSPPATACAEAAAATACRSIANCCLSRHSANCQNRPLTTMFPVPETTTDQLSRHCIQLLVSRRRRPRLRSC